MNRDHNRSLSSQYFVHAQNFRQTPIDSKGLHLSRNRQQTIRKDEKRLTPEKKRTNLSSICFVNPVMCDSDFEPEIWGVKGFTRSLVGNLFTYLCPLAPLLFSTSVRVICPFRLCFISNTPFHLCFQFRSLGFREQLGVCFWNIRICRFC
jgi:hypothetical protein